ncbi:MAG: tetratricopeptide repeat protein [Leptolyngbya sp.]|nr:tetratricopeptide repeat protein [Candidatus Melainabacteria bacterium]
MTGSVEPTIEERLQRALATLMEMVGDDHPHTALAQMRLGDYYYERAHYSKCHPYYVSVLEKHQKLYGMDTIETAMATHKLALLYHVLEKYDLAEPLYNEALRVLRKERGDYHADVLGVLKDFATMLQMTNRDAEAQELLNFAQDHLSGRWKTIPYEA